MAPNYRTHIGDTAPDDVTPKHLSKQEFAQRVYNLMMEKRWTQSDLARASGLTRDSISTYVRAASLPSPVSLQKLAVALGVDKEKLLPNHTEGAIDRDIPSLELKVSPSAPSRAWLRVNRMVSTGAALKVVEILEHDSVADTERSSGKTAEVRDDG